MLANNVEIRVFSKQGEDFKKVLEGLHSLFPFDLEKEKIRIDHKQAIGFNEKKIVIICVFLGKQRHINDFLKYLKEKLSEEQKELLLKQAESRLDNGLCFFIRLDKNKLIEEKLFWITDEGDCYHITISVAAFPKKRGVALQNLQKIFK